MCGIAALIDSRGGRNLAPLIRAMTDLVRHRGPDDEGYALFGSEPSGLVCCSGDDTPPDCSPSGLPYAPETDIASVGIPQSHAALGHRRLSIVDLSPAGHQPMTCENRRFVITYNGELYNHREIRAELEASGVSFASRSDTEVVLKAYRQWGTACLERFNGMFAMVILDRLGRRLFAARDRFGIKPLYYWQSACGMLAFASEIKQFSVLPDWRAQANGQLVYDYLNWGLTDHTSETLFRNVHQIPGGSYLETTLDNAGGELHLSSWYQLPVGESHEPLPQARSRLASLLFDSVRMRRQADVAVGTGLSGGIDSSSIVCIISRLRSQGMDSGAQKTFSACSHVAAFDERTYADTVVEHAGVDAHFVYPSLDALWPRLDAMLWHHDEPFASTSVYAEWSVFDLVQRNGIKVTLDGHGADELFGGYHAFLGPQLAALLLGYRWRTLLRELSAQRLMHHAGLLYSVQHLLNIMLPEFLRQPLMHAALGYSQRVSWLPMDKLDAVERDPFTRYGAKVSDISAYSRSQLLHTSLPMQLRWADRDSMAHSVESRVPYLDYLLVEFVLACPDRYKIADGVSKILLREAMARILPKRILNRRDKMGFVTPESHWVRSQGRDEFQAQVERAVESSKGILQAAVVDKVKRIVGGQERFSHLPWRVLCFGRWMERFGVEGC